MIKSIGVPHTLMLLGAVYLVIVVIAAQFLRSAPEGFAPRGCDTAGDHAARLQQGVDACPGRCAPVTGISYGECWRSTLPPAQP